MRKAPRARPVVEFLENRLCPTALTARLISGTLYVNGDSASGSIALTQSAGTGEIQVLDGAADLGTFAANGIALQNGNAAESITLTVAGGHTLTGNVSLVTGNGDDQIVVTGDGNGLAQITGNLTIYSGQGTNQVSLGTTGGLTVGGNVLLVGFSSDAYSIDNGTVINGNVSATDPTGTFQLGGTGTGATVKGTVTINGTGSHNVTVAANATVLGNFLAYTYGGVNQVTVNGPVQGNVNVSETGTASNLTLTAPVGRSLTYTSAGTNSVMLALGAAISGDVALNLGNGDSNYLIGAGVAIGGNLRIYAGNGTDTGTLRGTVNGSLTVNVGNGANTLIVANAPGGILYWTSGNGNSSLLLGNSPFTTGPETWRVDVRFGTGNDTFGLSGAVARTQLITGQVDMGGPPGGNSFDPGMALGVNWQVAGWLTVKNV